MVERFLKEKEETLYRVGNIVVLLIFFLSLVWFLSFSIYTMDQAFTVDFAKQQEEEASFHIDDFEKIKVLFDRKDVGFAALREDKTPPE